MRKSRYTEEQIAFALGQTELGTNESTGSIARRADCNES
jgi:hypothetical protein